MQSIIDKLQTPQSFLQSVQVTKLISYVQGQVKLSIYHNDNNVLEVLANPKKLNFAMNMLEKKKILGLFFFL